MPPAWSTTTCSRCVAPSAPSPRSPTAGPTRRSTQRCTRGRHGGRFASREVHTSYLQRLGVRQRGFRRLLPLYPRAVERLPVSGHDVVLSSSSAFAHGVRPKRRRRSTSVTATARSGTHGTRTSWRCERRPPSRGRWCGACWTASAAGTSGGGRRVTHYIANSEITRERIHACYGRDANVIHPPVEIGWLEPGTPEDFFLVVTELAPHKRVHIALEAARLAGKRIKVVGAGPELARLRSTFGDSAEFLGRVSRPSELARLYPRALALVVPNVEEFGIAAVEAQAAGRPVVAVDAGGTRRDRGRTARQACWWRTEARAGVRRGPEAKSTSNPSRRRDQGARRTILQASGSSSASPQRWRGSWATMRPLLVNHTGVMSGAEVSLLDLVSGCRDEIHPLVACPGGRACRRASRHATSMST